MTAIANANVTYYLCEECSAIETDTNSDVTGNGCPANFSVAATLKGNAAKHYFDTGANGDEDYFKNQDVYVYDVDDRWTRYLGADGEVKLRASQTNVTTYVCSLTTSDKMAEMAKPDRWSYDGDSTSNDVKGAHKFLTASFVNTPQETGSATVGKFQIAYHVQDQHGNWECTTRYRTVYVQDTLPPVLALHYNDTYFQNSGAHGIAQQSLHEVFVNTPHKAINFDQTNTFPRNMKTG